MGTVQNVTLSLPIIARVPPPEGQTGANVNFTLDGGNVATYNLFQLNSQNGLVMSQVCSLCVDNTKNGGLYRHTWGIQRSRFDTAIYISIFPDFFDAGTIPIVDQWAQRLHRSCYPLKLCSTTRPIPDNAPDFYI